MQEPSMDRTSGVSANLHQILDLILDKGLVIDLAYRWAASRSCRSVCAS